MLVADRPPLDEASLAVMGMYTIAGEQYLSHDGVKGMKWGVRKARDVIGFNRPAPPPQTPAQRQQVRNNLVKAAIVVGAVAVGAILLKRGGFKMSSPASKKIALGGAKMSLQIMQKSGRLMASTAAKVGSTVGKTAVKGTAKVGTAIAKGGVKGAIAGTKAGGRAIAQNGAKFYEKGIKGAGRGIMKVGSHAVYKFTGKGKPAVEELAKRSFNLSPTDLLLNVRADKWRGR